MSQPRRTLKILLAEFAALGSIFTTILTIVGLIVYFHQYAFPRTEAALLDKRMNDIETIEKNHTDKLHSVEVDLKNELHSVSTQINSRIDKLYELNQRALKQ